MTSGTPGGSTCVDPYAVEHAMRHAFAQLVDLHVEPGEVLGTV